MTGRTTGIITASVAAVVLLCLAAPAVLLSGAVTAACAHGSTPPPSLAASTRPIDGWDAEQVANARTIITVGAQQSVPSRGWIIAVATAIQESQLRNLPGGDRDSVGLFQQRPSQGWGTPDQLQDPAYAAGKFYSKLVTVPGWQTMPLTDAAQAVQRSAFPDAYAKWEDDATALVQHVGSANWLSIPEDLEQCLANCPEILSSDGQSSPAPGCLPGVTVLARAATWLTAWDGGPVPYLSSADSATWFNGYRRDCSGYASMALGLAGPGLNTAGLAARSTPIQQGELRAGDLLINPAPGGAGHVVIFDQWTDATMRSYLGYEQSGDGGTHHRVIPYPYFGGYQMSPYRFASSTSPRSGKS